jgi:HEPN domain-containing protein
MPFHAGQMASNIVKLHGDLRHEEHIIVTQKDYDAFLEQYPVIATHLSAMLITRTPFFIGYSLSDPDFLNIRNVVRSRLGNFERMAYVVQFDATDEDVEKALGDRIHVVSLSTGAKRSRDEALADLFRTVQKQMDTDAGAKFRASRPDAFEPLERHVVAGAVESAEASTVLAATSNLCFVLMPFSERFDVVYRTLIVPVATELGLTVVRADELSAPGSIMEQIRVAIQQARLCIADLTENNANVMFELGLAQAAGKPTVLLSQDLSGLPFDVRSQRIVKYDESNPRSAQAQLEQSLKTVLSTDRLMNAKRLFSLGHYRAAVWEAFDVLQYGLRRLSARGQFKRLGLHKTGPLGEILTRLESAKVLSAKERASLVEVMSIRNNAVHLPDEPTQDEASKVVNVAEQFLARFGADS